MRGNPYQIAAFSIGCAGCLITILLMIVNILLWEIHPVLGIFGIVITLGFLGTGPFIPKPPRE
jgi:hypothetical protein